MHFADHSPPHFHAMYGEFEAVIRIADGAVVRGRLPKRARRMVEEWRVANAEGLAKAWNRASQSQHPGSLDPLA
jgi:hypothetical protein